VTISGTARVGAKTKDLVKKLQPGDIAVISHKDLDEVAAKSLAAARVRAVIDAASAMTGRYPNQGPRVLLAEGVPMIDEAGPNVMDITDGETITIKDNEIFAKSGWVAAGRVLSSTQVDELLTQARANLAGEVEAFFDNTLAFAAKEKRYFTEDMQIPPLHPQMQGKHVLVVVRGASYKEDLRAIDSYIRDIHPVLIGVDGGADALIEAGYTPELIVGDMDSVSDQALRCGAQLLVQAYMDGRSPGAKRLEELGLAGEVISAPGTSEDLALLMAYQLGAELIVAVGAHSNEVDFLEKGRSGMSSTLLARMKIGSILVDAKGVSKLYNSAPRSLYPFQVAVAALIPILLVGLLSADTRHWFNLLVVWLGNLL